MSTPFQAVALPVSCFKYINGSVISLSRIIKRLLDTISPFTSNVLVFPTVHPSLACLFIATIPSLFNDKIGGSSGFAVIFFISKPYLFVSKLILLLLISL